MADYAEYAAAMRAEGVEPMPPEEYATSVYADLADIHANFRAEYAAAREKQEAENLERARRWAAHLNSPTHIEIAGKLYPLSRRDMYALHDMLHAVDEDRNELDEQTIIENVLQACLHLGLIKLNV